MKFNRILSCLAGATLGGAALQAQVLVQYNFGSIDTAIPDASPSGLADSRNISSIYNSIQSVTVDLTIQGTGEGAFNGDYYAYLSHAGEIAVLLNRVGTTAGNSFGYEDNGFSTVTFSDSASNGDIHLYQNTTIPSGNGPLTSTWAPDGRNVNPSNVLDSTPRTATFNAFSGMDPNGAWTLFIADLSGGGNAQLTGWSLNVTAVPEPGAYGLVAGTLLLGVGIWRKSRR